MIHEPVSQPCFIEIGYARLISSQGHIGHIRPSSDENSRKTSNRFLFLHFNTKIKVKAVKPDTKTNTNLRNIENFENELIRAELYRTRSLHEKLIRNIDP